MAKARTTPKLIRLSLGYDSYSVEGETDKILVFAFESPPIARLAFEQHLARARGKKRLAATDTTRRLDHLQAEWRGDRIARAWLSAIETHDDIPDRLASEQLAAALARPELAAVEEIGIGLPQWQNSHRASFDSVLDVLAATRPPLTALAFGDYLNDGGHVLRFVAPARIGELYPALERLRITTTTLSVLDASFPALRSLWLWGTSRDVAALAALDRQWPALDSLGVGWRRPGGAAETLAHWEWLLAGERTPALRHLCIASSIDDELVRALASSPLLPRLRSLELRELGGKIGNVLRSRRDTFAHLERLTLPEEPRVAGLDGLAVEIRPALARYRSSRE